MWLMFESGFSPDGRFLLATSHALFRIYGIYPIDAVKTGRAYVVFKFGFPDWVNILDKILPLPPGWRGGWNSFGCWKSHEWRSDQKPSYTIQESACGGLQKWEMKTDAFTRGEKYVAGSEDEIGSACWLSNAKMCANQHINTDLTIHLINYSPLNTLLPSMPFFWIRKKRLIFSF